MEKASVVEPVVVRFDPSLPFATEAAEFVVEELAKEGYVAESRPCVVPGETAKTVLDGIDLEIEKLLVGDASTD